MKRPSRNTGRDIVDRLCFPFPQTTFLEACVGETCAALEAAEAAARATDPVVASALARIAEDEARHAELGFRFVKWALGSMDARTRRALERALAEDLGRELWRVRGIAPVPTEADSALEPHGVLPAAVRRAVREAALRDAVVPCLAAVAAGDTRVDSAA